MQLIVQGARHPQYRALQGDRVDVAPRGTQGPVRHTDAVQATASGRHLLVPRRQLHEAGVCWCKQAMCMRQALAGAVQATPRGRGFAGSVQATP